jgi:hypothetical protein
MVFSTASVLVSTDLTLITCTSTTRDTLDNSIKRYDVKQVKKSEKDLHPEVSKQQDMLNKRQKTWPNIHQIIKQFVLAYRKHSQYLFLRVAKFYCLWQLWTPIFCVHNLGSGDNIFFWHEGEVSRVSQDISLCLLRYIQVFPPNVTHIHALSYNAGGQDNNKNITKFRNYVVTQANVKQGATDSWSLNMPLWNVNMTLEWIRRWGEKFSLLLSQMTEWKSLQKLVKSSERYEPPTVISFPWNKWIMQLKTQWKKFTRCSHSIQKRTQHISSSTKRTLNEAI